jgi:hypothetical protein
MFKKIALIIPFIFMFFHAELTIAEDLPEGTVQSGTLTNEKLMGDTMIGVATKVDTEGCNKPDSFLAYISRLPEGESGSRSWREKWIVYGCGNSYPVDIEFKEDGLDAANFSIR